MAELSTKQKQILSFLTHFLQEKGYPPSIRDVGKACGISSTSVVNYNLNILERERYIRRDPEVSRGIEVVKRPRRDRIVHVPLLGYIAAGHPIPVPDEETWNSITPLEVLELTQQVTKNKKNLYALKVNGMSMIDAFINDGDIVLMQSAQTAENGEMVAVWLKAEKETTLKRFYAEGGRVRLQPANQEMKPIYVDSENVEIQGKVVGVLRLP